MHLIPMFKRGLVTWYGMGRHEHEQGESGTEDGHQENGKQGRSSHCEGRSHEHKYHEMHLAVTDIQQVCGNDAGEIKRQRILNER